MINNQPTHLELLHGITRQTRAVLELYDGSSTSPLAWITWDYDLVSLKLERIGKGKFFGYGYNQKLEVKIQNKRNLDIKENNYFKVFFGVEGAENNINNFPDFYVSEVKKDENTGELTIIAYDRIKAAAAHTVSEIAVETFAESDSGYTILEFANRCAAALGLDSVGLVGMAQDDYFFSLTYPEGANFEGTETIREALDAIADVTMSIYYIGYNNSLIFKRLLRDAAADYDIPKSRYFTLDSESKKVLESIVFASELGNNLGEQSGITQYVRDNPFLELREDADVILTEVCNYMCGLTITPFKCEWRGNYLLEIGDKLDIVAKDDTTFSTFLLNDTLTYNGALKQVSEWVYEENEKESHSNPNTLGEALKQTFAKVDKANKQIELVASESKANAESIAALQLNTESINASVAKMEQINQESMDTVNADIATLTEKVDLAITSDQVKIEIQSQLENGVSKVATNTGFTFDDTGLTVSKENSEMTTTITEDGMTVYKDNNEMLVANNKGVNAVNLHATTYLIIGSNSRLEDYDGNRTACFWIGGN